MANSEATNTDETISSLSRRCTSGFKLYIENSHAGDLEVIDDAHGRFNVWAANLGALQPPQSLKSLEFRLKDAELMRSSVISGLERLERVQIRVTRILAGEQPNRKPTEKIFEETHPEIKEPVMDELHELLLNMKTCVDHLFGLSMLIRRLKPKGKFRQLSSFQPSDNFHRDVVTVTDKFPKTRQTPWLADRLGRATDQRRQFFAYRQQHRAHLGNISKGKQVLSVNDDATLGAPTTVATTFEEGDDHPLETQDVQLDRGTVVTAATSLVSDFDESAQMGRHIPELPDMTLDGIQLGYKNSIECPYCRTIQSVTNRFSWKKHVFSDLQPYVCTFENCTAAPFSTRNDWFQHELDNHRRRWECVLCNSPRPAFLRRVQITTHFREHHEDSITEDQVDLIIGACEIPITKFDASACLLCSEWVPPSEDAINLREFRRHLAKHLQQISLEALPLYIEGLVIEETLDQDDAVGYKKGVVLLDSRQSSDNTGLSFAKGDEVLILDNMFDEHLWQVRVIRTGQDGLIPGEAVSIVGATSMSSLPLGDLKPDPSKMRIWTNRSGLFSVQAQFIGVEDDKILLLKLGGIKIRVSREKLSFQDLAYVEDILETEFDSEDNTGSDTTQSERSRSDAGAPLHTALSARVISFGSSTEGEGWFIVQALFQDGQTWELTRYSEDLYALHKEVLAELSSEVLPDLPRHFLHVPEALKKRRLPELNSYLTYLLGHRPHILTSLSVERFFAPRDGDGEIDPVDWREPSTDGLYSSWTAETVKRFKEGLKPTGRKSSTGSSNSRTPPTPGSVHPSPGAEEAATMPPFPQVTGTQTARYSPGGVTPFYPPSLPVERHGGPFDRNDKQ